MPCRFAAASTPSPRQSLRVPEQNAARPASSRPPDSSNSVISSSWSLSDWAFGGLIGGLGGLLPGDAGVKVSCTGIMPPVVNKETGGTPATAIYIAYGYAPQGLTGQMIVTAFVGDKYYQSTFQVHTVTKDSGHDGATARSVGVAALAGIVAVLLMG